MNAAHLGWASCGQEDTGITELKSSGKYFLKVSKQSGGPERKQTEKPAASWVSASRFLLWFPSKVDCDLEA